MNPSVPPGTSSVPPTETHQSEDDTWQTGDIEIPSQPILEFPDVPLSPKRPSSSTNTGHSVHPDDYSLPSDHLADVSDTKATFPSSPVKSVFRDQTSLVYDSPRRVLVPSGSLNPIYDTQLEELLEFHTTHTAVIARRPEQSPRLSVSSLNSSQSPQPLDKMDSSSDGHSPVRPLVINREPRIREITTVHEVSGESLRQPATEFPEPQVKLPEDPSVPLHMVESTTGTSSDTPLPPPDTRFTDRDPQRSLTLLNRLLKATVAETPLLVAAARSPQLTHQGSPSKDTQFAFRYTDSGYILPYLLELLGSSNYGTAEIMTRVKTPQGNATTQESKRVAINPFDVLYESTLSSNERYRTSAVSAETQYRRVQLGVAQKTMHRRVELELAPVITIVDPLLRRQGLVISRLATLRNRNLIKRRNKMIKKNELKNVEDCQGKSKPLGWRIRLRRCLFPISRQRLFKYRAIKNQKPDFKTDAELARALSRSNAASVIKYLLPNEADFYRYHQLFRANPLRLHRRYKVVTDKLGFYEIAPKPVMQILAPLKETFRKNGEPIALSNINLYDTAYLRYRLEVFNGNYRSVPQFQQIFPNDLSLLLAAEVDRANRTILLELLLRRTIAAKIEYRLKQYGSSRRSFLSSLDDSLFRRPPNRAGKNTMNFPDAGPPPLTKDNGSDFNDDEEIELINTDVILQHNADLLSELLPLPQLTEALSFGLGVLKNGLKASLMRPLMPLPHLHAVTADETDENPTESHKRASCETREAGYLDDAVARLGMYQLRPVPRLEATLSSLGLELQDQNLMLQFLSLLNVSSSSKKKSLVLTERRTLVDLASKKTPPLLDYALLFEAGDENFLTVKPISERPKSPQPLQPHELHMLSSVEYRNHLMTHVVPEPLRVEIRLMKGLLMEALSTRWLGLQQLELPVRKPKLDVINSCELFHQYDYH